MKNLMLPLYSHDNGSIIMIGVFSLVVVGLVVAVLLMMGNSKNKKD